MDRFRLFFVCAALVGHRRGEFVAEQLHQLAAGVRGLRLAENGCLPGLSTTTCNAL